MPIVSSNQVQERMSKIYVGIRDMTNGGGVRGTCRVWVGDKEITPDDGTEFEWGCPGSFSGNMASAILLDCYREGAIDYGFMIRFRKDIIERLSFDKWVLDEGTIDDLLDKYEWERKSNVSKNN